MNIVWSEGVKREYASKEASLTSRYLSTTKLGHMRRIVQAPPFMFRLLLTTLVVACALVKLAENCNPSRDMMAQCIQVESTLSLSGYFHIIDQCLNRCGSNIAHVSFY